MVKQNEYIDDNNLSKLSSLTHLLDNDDGHNDTNDTHTIILTMLYQMDFFQKLHFQLVYPITQVR